MIDTFGFRDDLWIDWDGSVIAEAAKVRERIRRPDCGHLEIEVTVDDPKAYTKPWPVNLRQQFAKKRKIDKSVSSSESRSSTRAIVIRTPALPRAASAATDLPP